VQPAEYAPEYSPAERVRFVGFGLAAGALVLAACQLWLFPLLREFSASAPCRSVFGFSGLAVLFHGMFVGIPGVAAALVGLLVGRRGAKVLRQGRHPPAGEKVFRRTLVVRGAKAKVLGWVQLLAALPVLGLAAWGAFQAQALLDQVPRNPARCAVSLTSCPAGSAHPARPC
jgi:hypothetical protein